MQVSKLFKYLKDKANFWFGNKKFYHRNCEKIKELNLEKKFYKNRQHGLSAMMRVKNDEGFIFYAINSIIDYVDEIIVVLQNSTDQTEKIIRSIDSPKIKIYQFPFDSFPSGQYHEKFIKDSLFNRAYYYNFALSKTKYSYVWKWDGDQAAFEGRVKLLREIVDSKKYDIIHCKGYDAWGADLKFLCKSPYTSNEPSIFKVTKRTFYISGKICEEFSYPLSFWFRKMKILNFEPILFIHFKYTLNISQLGKGWEVNWEDNEYFQGILNRKSKGELYTDEYPEVVKKHYFATIKKNEEHT